MYLIHGDDHGAVAERRVRLRAVAEALGSGTDIEAFTGTQATPAAVAGALAAGTLALGRRVIIVDGVERWKEDDVNKHLVDALAQMPAETTLALFACEDTRVKAPPALHRAVAQAGGSVAREATLSAAKLAQWVSAQARRQRLELDTEAAKALVQQVGERRQRLARELEKLALELADSTDGSRLRVVTADEIYQRAAHSAGSEVFVLADALIAGGGAQAVRSYVRLRGQGERLPGLLALMASRLRQALSVTMRLQAGEPAASVRRTLRMPNAAAERLIADARAGSPERLQHALAVLADLELHTRGGPVVHSLRPPAAALSEDTQALRAIEAIAGARS